MPGLRITGATLVPMDGPADQPLGAVGPGSLRIRGDRIVALGDLPPEPGEVELDAAGLVALPGFVQVHLHCCQTLFRGLADDLPLLDWLQQRIWPLEAAHDYASTAASAELSSLELLAGGTTTVQVMESVHHAEATFAVLGRVGFTAIVGNCLMDQHGDGVPPKLPTTAAEALRLSAELARAFDRQGRLHYAVSPRFILSCSEGLARDAAAFARQHGLRVHTHAGEHPAEVAAVRQRFGRDYVLALRDQGLLGAQTGLAHCVHTTDAERQALVETGSAVLHCPSTNLKLGSGLAPIAAYRRLGLRVGLGADGAPCNNRLCALTELRQAALLQNVVAGPGAFSAAHALWTATLGGAQALGLGAELGSLTPGKRADVVLLDLQALQPGGEPASEIVYRADQQTVRHVVLGGAVVVRDRQVLTMDAAGIRREAVGQRQRLLARAGLAR